MPTRREMRAIAAETRELLRLRFPAAFAPKGGEKRPLRLRIDKDIRKACPDLPWRKIKAALQDYVTGPRYARAMIEGAARIGLDGEPSGAVSTEHAARAAAYLADWESRKAAAK